MTCLACDENPVHDEESGDERCQKMCMECLKLWFPVTFDAENPFRLALDRAIIEAADGGESV